MTAACNRTNAAWLRAQIADLRWAVAGRAISADQLLRALDISEGRTWNSVSA